jgi:glycosyltransferase involved in cell wall biosynthesis
MFSAGPTTPALRQRIKHAIIKLTLNALGTLEMLSPSRLSKELERWIADFQPQVAFVSFSTWNSMRLTLCILDNFDLPYVAIINDDWISSIYSHGICSGWFRKRAQAQLTLLLSECRTAVGVSPEMCQAYQQRYGRPFQWFSGPIELSKLLPYARKNWNAGDPFRLLYAGRVGRANTASIIDACIVISGLRRRGYNIVFDLYLTTGAENINPLFSGEDGVFLHASISYKDTPLLFASADVLLLPLDFDDDALSFARYSMSTKIAEYMAAAVPILVYAPKELAMCSYAIREKWGYVVSQRSQEALRDAIVRLSAEESLRECIGRQALEVAERNHDAAIVRRRFQHVLRGAACAQG